ncbi:hypothetical protein ACNTMW_25850 [Planosporangium sp. 12N6]|uniref:hypothetical protein n=1 Tax=Planosporangium spinosum TaxID=3402278 RepID=UPI003CEA3DB0
MPPDVPTVPDGGGTSPDRAVGTGGTVGDESAPPARPGAALTAHPLVARIRDLAATGSQRVRFAVAAGAAALVLLVGFVSCSGPDAGPGGLVPAGTAVFSASAESPGSAAATSRAPAATTDGCHGIVTAAQVSKAAGFEAVGAGGDAAAAVTAYAETLRARGLAATVHVCPFVGTHGDQVHVMALVFPDARQAERMYADTKVGTKALSGVGDAAVTDGARTLSARRGRSVVLVQLIRVASPTADNTAPLRALALAALAKV